MSRLSNDPEVCHDLVAILEQHGHPIGPDPLQAYPMGGVYTGTTDTGPGASMGGIWEALGSVKFKAKKPDGTQHTIFLHFWKRTG